MKAVLLKGFGGVEQLTVGNTAKPTLRSGELLVKVKATAINRADLLQRAGRYPPPPGESDILGLEFSGVVAAVGDQVHGWKEGERVMALVGGGAYAEYCSVLATHAMEVPANLSLTEAAAVPEAYLTSFQALDYISKVREKVNPSVLIHAAASGVGTAAIQLARVAKVNPIIVTAGSAEKLAFCQSLGANVLINYKEGSFLPKVLEATNKKGVDIILDFIGASYWNDNLKSLAVDGTMTMQGSLGGVKLQDAELGAILGKRLTIQGSSLRSRSAEYKTQLISAFSQYGLPLLEKGELKPIVDKVFELQDVAAAHEFVEANKNTGKVVLNISNDL